MFDKIIKEKMNEFKGTPGPWTLADENNSSCDVNIGETVASLSRYPLHGDGFVIERSEMFANAKLVMAAPDLLKALQSFCDKCNEYNIELLAPEYGIAMDVIEKALKQMNKPKLLIGIDPGNTTGVSFWYPAQKILKPMQFKTHIEAVLAMYKALKDLNEYSIRIIIEDARKQRKRPDLGIINKGKQQGVGSVKARSKDWEEFCINQGYDYELREPKNTPYKNNPALFKKLTGIATLKTQSHLRDASMLVFGF